MNGNGTRADNHSEQDHSAGPGFWRALIRVAQDEVSAHILVAASDRTILRQAQRHATKNVVPDFVPASTQKHPCRLDRNGATCEASKGARLPPQAQLSPEKGTLRGVPAGGMLSARSSAMVRAEAEERTRRRASASSARVCDRSLSLCKAGLPSPERGDIKELPL